MCMLEAGSPRATPGIHFIFFKTDVAISFQCARLIWSLLGENCDSIYGQALASHYIMNIVPK